MADNEWKSERNKKKKWEIAKNFYKIYFGIDVIGVLIILIVLLLILVLNQRKTSGKKLPKLSIQN